MASHDAMDEKKVEYGVWGLVLWVIKFYLMIGFASYFPPILELM